jgi:predicted NUDIX family NTP pyrophosphohydrolase
LSSRAPSNLGCHPSGDGTFTDVSQESGIAKVLGKAWGVVATDINSDGWMDLFMANDTVANAQRLAARRMAVRDFNNDGALDVLVAVNGGPPLLLKNVAAGENHWLGLRLIGKKANPDGVGARITWQAGDLKRSRLKVGGGSYLSSHDPREVLGIGKRTKIEKVEIQWPQPSGRVETFTELPVDRYIAVVEGVGIK